MVVNINDCDAAVSYVWTANNGTTGPSEQTNQSSISYTAPTITGEDIISVQVRDIEGRSTSDQVSVFIVENGDPTPIRITATPTPLPTLTPAVTPTIVVIHNVSISMPTSEPYDCPGDGPCLVEVAGRFAAPNERRNVHVLVLVLPVDPSGGGWWIQDSVRLDRLDGTWEGVATLGNSSTLPVTGDRFSLRALLVEQRVAEDSQFAPGTSVEDYTVIPYLAASGRVDLQIQSP